MFHYNNETGECECLGHLFNKFGITLAMCANNRAFIRYTYCMTYNEVINTLSASFCLYFELSGHNTSDFAPGFINLPDNNNISKLNDYMCGPMNRKGLVCSECIDSYGSSVTSPNFRCADCSNALYGIPLYLLLELVPSQSFILWYSSSKST